jgi:CRP/FNR family transcriptional regulator, polysaccharide utilization system transcription regulator
LLILTLNIVNFSVLNPSSLDSKNSKGRFATLFHRNQDEIHANQSVSHFRKGETIFKEGTAPLGLFCINKGKVKLSIMGEDGKEQIIRLANEGDIMGYRALLSGGLYHATAVPLEACELSFVSKEIFLDVLREDSALSFEMMKLLSEDLKNAETQITHLAQKPVRERLAEAVLFLKQTYSFEEDLQTINVMLTREELANIVGTATETAIRLLSEFKQDGIIDLIGKKIKILDLPRLVKTANIQD